MAHSNAMPQPALILSRPPETAQSFPGLETVGDRAANAMRDMLARFGCRNVEIVQAEAELLSAKAWQTCKGDAAVCAFAMAPYKGDLVASFDPDLIVRLVDTFYGGVGDTEPFQGKFGSADLRMMARIGDDLTGTLPSIWQDIAEIAPAALPAGSTGQALRGHNGKIILHSYEITGLGASPVHMSWEYPVELLRQIPALGPGNPPDAVPAYDRVWHENLNRAVMEVSLPVRTIFARPEVPLSRLLVLKPGDIIPLCLPSTVPVTIAGRIFAEGTVGESGGRTAIRISRIAEGSLVDD